MRVLGALLVAAIAFGATIFFMWGGFGRLMRHAPTTQVVKTSDQTRPGTLPPPPPVTDPDKLLYRALEYRNTENAIKLLKEHPELANKRTNDVPYLWRACEWGSLPVVKAFVENGAKLDVRNYENRTILWAAVFTDNREVAKYLIEKGADPKAPQDDDKTMLWGAHSKEMAELLIKAGVDPKHKNFYTDTALHQACRNCLADVVAVLLENGLDVEAVGHWNMRPIHSSASSITADARPVLNVLLEHKVKLDSRGTDGHTALHECALFNNYDNAAWLLTRGADPNLKDETGRTPLDVAKQAGTSERILLINLLIRHNGRGGDGAPATLIPVPK